MTNTHYLFIFDDINSTVCVSVYPKMEKIRMTRYRGVKEDVPIAAGLNKEPNINKVHLTMWDIAHFADVVRGSELIRQSLGGPFGLHIVVDYALRDDFAKLFNFCYFFSEDM